MCFVEFKKKFTTFWTIPLTGLHSAPQERRYTVLHSVWLCRLWPRSSSVHNSVHSTSQLWQHNNNKKLFYKAAPWWGKWKNRTATLLLLVILLVPFIEPFKIRHDCVSVIIYPTSVCSAYSGICHFELSAAVLYSRNVSYGRTELHLTRFQLMF